MKVTHGAALALTRPVLVAAAYVQTFGTEVLGPGSPFRELGQFQRDFDEVFDQCLQARWRSAMRPRALPVESHIEGDQVVIRADLLRRSERHSNGRPRAISRSAATDELEPTR